MTEDDLKSIIARYQQKSFDLFNQNIILEIQIEKLNAIVNALSVEIENLKKNKKGSKPDDEFS